MAVVTTNPELVVVLVADDDEAVRSFMASALRNRGFNVVEAKDGLDALSWADGYRGRIHLLVTDCAMPKMDGIQLAERLNSLHPETQILFVTGCWTGPLPSDERVLHKPFGVKDLFEKVEGLLVTVC